MRVMRDRMGPHTIAFGLFLAAMTAGLLARGSWLYAGLFGALLALELGLTRKAQRDPRAPWTVAADAFYPVALNIVFPAMAVAIPAVHPVKLDAQLFAIDARLFHGNWSERLDAFASPALTELMSGCYMLFMPLLYGNLLRYFLWQRERRAGFLAGLFTVYGAGFLGYLLVPAAGPYVAFANAFRGPLPGGALWHLNQAMVAFGSNGVDVFPSLHAAVSVYILAFAWSHARREFWLLVPLVLGICISTIYLRYHYLVDVVCGVLLALVASAASLRAGRARQSISLRRTVLESAP
jgi:membrane-associated phospholipid phosphatase